MKQPHSSFYNMQAIDDDWSSDSDFKSKLGALDFFETHHNLKSESSFTQESHGDFTARFNVLPDFETHYNFSARQSYPREKERDFEVVFDDPKDFETHYNFFAQWLTYDSSYNFRATVVPLEMEIEYEDDGDLVAVLRVVEISKPNELNFIDERETLKESVEALGLLGTRDTYVETSKDAYVDAVESVTLTVEGFSEASSIRNVVAAVEVVNFMDKEIIRTINVEVPENSNDVSGIEAAKEGFYLATNDINLDAMVSTPEKALVITSSIADVSSQSDGTVTSDLYSRIEHSTQVAKSLDIHSVIDVPTPVDRVDDINIAVDESTQLTRIEDHYTDIGEVLVIGLAPMDTAIEQLTLGDRLANKQAAIEDTQKAESSKFHPVEIEAAKESHTSSVEVAEIEWFERADKNSASLTKVESVSTSDFATTCIIEVEDSTNGEANTELSTTLEKHTRIKRVEETLTALDFTTDTELSNSRITDIGHVDELENLAIYTVNIDSADKLKDSIFRITSMESHSKALLDSVGHVEVDGITPVDRVNEHCAEIEHSVDADPSIALSTVIEKSDKLLRIEDVRITLEVVNELDRIEDMNATLEGSSIGTGAPMATEIEETITGDRNPIRDIDIETSEVVDSLTTKDVDINQSFTGSVHNTHRAAVEETLNGAMDDQFSSDISQEITSRGIKVFKSDIDSPDEASAFNGFNVDVLTPHGAIKQVLYGFDISTSIASGKVINDTTADLEEGIENTSPIGHVAEVEGSINGEVSTAYRATIEDYAKVERVEERLTEIEKRYGSCVFTEYISEIEDTIEGEKHDDKSDKDRLVWIIMGRPSWIHQYWQRTTR